MMKYVKHESLGFIVFEDKINHTDISNILPEGKILSAGFVIVDGTTKCFGESSTLFISSEKQDTSDLSNELDYP